MATIRLYRGVTGCMFSAVERKGFDGQFIERLIVDVHHSQTDLRNPEWLAAIVCSDGKTRVVSVSSPGGSPLKDVVSGSEILPSNTLDESAWSYFAQICGSDNKDPELLIAARSVEVEKTGANNNGSVYVSDIRKVTKTFPSGKKFTHRESVTGYSEGYAIKKLESITAI